MNNKLLLPIGLLLIIIGLIKPEFNFNNNTKPLSSPTVVTAPTDSDLKQACEPIIDILQKNKSNRSQDGKRLSDLYNDLATLIALDEQDEVIKTTEEIRQANSLSGLMLKLNLKGDYPGLSDAAQKLIISQIGDDSTLLDSSLRAKAATAFKALSWACLEGSK